MPLLEWKQTVLVAQAARPTCRRSWIGTDLREEWSGELRRRGVDAAQPAAFLAEGLLAYLSDPFGANPGSSMEPPWLETSFLQGTREA